MYMHTRTDQCRRERPFLQRSRDQEWRPHKQHSALLLGVHSRGELNHTPEGTTLSHSGWQPVSTRPFSLRWALMEFCWARYDSRGGQQETVPDSRLRFLLLFHSPKAGPLPCPLPFLAAKLHSSICSWQSRAEGRGWSGTGCGGDGPEAQPLNTNPCFLYFRNGRRK